MTDTERERINAICKVAHVNEVDDLSDGFHTFRQLYYHRMVLFAALVNAYNDKAWKHGSMRTENLAFAGAGLLYELIRRKAVTPITTRTNTGIGLSARNCPWQSTGTDTQRKM